MTNSMLISNTHLIVWSKNRACQLHVLLESIRKNASGIGLTTIIYKADDAHIESYKNVIEEFAGGGFSFTQETDFAADTLKAIDSGDFINVGFCTDDTVFFKPFDINDLCVESGRVFSLRLGLNTIMQNCYTGELQPPLNRYAAAGNKITWRPQDYHPLSNYGYPAALDAHIYNWEQIRTLCKSISFKNTNTLEGGLAQIAHRHFFSITSFSHSVAVNIPCNNMSGYTNSCEWHSYSCEELLQKYENGERICLKSISAHSFIGCHQEVPFKFIREENNG